MFGLSTLAARILLAAVAVILLLGILQVRSCQRSAQQAAQSRVDRGQAGAATESAKDAIGTVSNVSAAQAAGEDLTRSNEKEIRNAPGATAPVDPALRDAGLRAQCRRAAYRDSKRCKLLRAPAP